MPTFSRSLEQTLHRSLAFANERHHEYAHLEHLLLALTEDPDAAGVMRACNLDLEKLRRSLLTYIDNELDNLVIEGNEDSKPTAGFQRVVQRAVIHVQSSGREEVNGANVLVAIFAERESHAAYFLQEQDMTRYDAVNFISMGIAKRAGLSESRPVRGVDVEKPDVKPEVLLLSTERHRALEGWVSAVAASAGYGVRLSRRLTDLDIGFNSASHVIAIATPELKRTSAYQALGKMDLSRLESVIFLRIGYTVDLPASVNDSIQIDILRESAEGTCSRLFAAFDYSGSYDSFDDLFASAIDEIRESRTRGKGEERSPGGKVNRTLPGEGDFVWKEGKVLQSEFTASEIKIGKEDVKPNFFLKDYVRLVSEFTAQLGESNHSSYVKSQAKLLLDEVRLTPRRWDPQTVDRRVRALFSLLPNDDCPMNRLVELNLAELRGYQSNFRAVYPIVADRDRAMRSFEIPSTAPLQETTEVARELSENPEFIDASVPEKLQSAVRELKILDEEADSGKSKDTEEHVDTRRKRLIFKLAIMLNSIWTALKDPPKLVQKVESYKKLYETCAPIFKKIGEWASYF